MSSDISNANLFAPCTAVQRIHELFDSVLFYPNLVYLHVILNVTLKSKCSYANFKGMKSIDSQTFYRQHSNCISAFFLNTALTLISDYGAMKHLPNIVCFCLGLRPHYASYTLRLLLNDRKIIYLVPDCVRVSKLAVRSHIQRFFS